MPAHPPPAPLIAFAADPDDDTLVLTLEWRQNRFATAHTCPVFGMGFTPTLGPELFLVRPDNTLGDCISLDDFSHYFLGADEVDRPAGPYPHDGADEEGPRVRHAVPIQQPSAHLGLFNLFLVANREPEAFASSLECLARAIVRHAAVLFECHGNQWDLMSDTLAQWYHQADRTRDPFWSRPDVLLPGFPALAAEAEHAVLSRHLPQPSAVPARPRM